MSASVVPFIRSLPRHKVLGIPITDIVVAVALTALAFVPTLSVIGAQIGDLPKQQLDGWAVLLMLAQCVPLALRTRHPSVCLALVGAGFALHQTMAYPQTFASIGVYLAIYSAGAHQLRHRRATATIAAAIYPGFVVTLHLLGSPNRIQDFLAYFLVLAVVWLAGAGMRRWRSDERERRRLAVQLAATTERSRIARDLHDVVTHHVTAIVVQSDAAQFLVDKQPDRAAEGLTTISTTGRRALTELRQLLGLLEATGDAGSTDRSPARGRVADLVEQARNSGQPIELVETGQRHQSTNVTLAAYRVVQEALTNALKYAARQPTTVHIQHEDDRVEIEVTTAAVSASPPAAPSGGRGLSGLRERLQLMDGELEAGTRPDGGFTVRAVIPAGSCLDRHADSSTGL